MLFGLIFMKTGLILTPTTTTIPSFPPPTSTPPPLPPPAAAAAAAVYTTPPAPPPTTPPPPHPPHAGTHRPSPIAHPHQWRRRRQRQWKPHPRRGGVAASQHHPLPRQP